jgi:hypothetical protein
MKFTGGGKDLVLNDETGEVEIFPKRPRGRPRTGFDKKTYDRERMRRIRAEKRAAKSAD